MCSLPTSDRIFWNRRRYRTRWSLSSIPRDNRQYHRLHRHFHLYSYHRAEFPSIADLELRQWTATIYARRWSTRKYGFAVSSVTWDHFPERNPGNTCHIEGWGARLSERRKCPRCWNRLQALSRKVGCRWKASETESRLDVAWMTHEASRAVRWLHPGRVGHLLWVEYCRPHPDPGSISASLGDMRGIATVPWSIFPATRFGASTLRARDRNAREEVPSENG